MAFISFSQQLRAELFRAAFRQGQGSSPLLGAHLEPAEKYQKEQW